MSAEGEALLPWVPRAVFDEAHAQLVAARAALDAVKALCEPEPARRDDQCVHCGDRRLHHDEGGCGLCGFCGGFARRGPVVSAETILAALAGVREAKE